MFEDCLIESGGKLKTKRGTTTLISFIFEIIFLGILVLLPLIFTEALPTKQLMTMLTAPPPPPPPPPPAAAPVVVRKMQSELDNGQLRTPTAIPKKIEMIKEDEAPPNLGGVAGGVPGGVPGGVTGGVMSSIMNVPTAIPKAATPQRVRVSQGVSQGLLIHKVTPQYPPLARQARIQGVVVLQAEIGKDGSIQNLHVVSGHPMLTNAALEAVKEWRYKPYYLNGEPVEVETTINVNFTLSGE
jgi:protein TonB